MLLPPAPSACPALNLLMSFFFFFLKLAKYPGHVLRILKAKLAMEVLSTSEFCSVTLIPFL